MTAKLYMVHLKGAQDSEDRAYRQPVHAEVEVSAEGLIFSWAEVDESQLTG